MAFKKFLKRKNNLNLLKNLVATLPPQWKNLVVLIRAQRRKLGYEHIEYIVTPKVKIHETQVTHNAS